MTTDVTPIHHFLQLRSALSSAAGLSPDDIRRTETLRRVQECMALIAAGVPCEHKSAVPGNGTQAALQAFMEAQVWNQYPESAGPISELFAAYVRGGSILVDGPPNPVIEPGTGKTKHWLPLEQAVVTPCIPTLLALIDNGADTTKVEGGDLIAFARKNTPQSKIDQMVVDITEAVMRRQISLAAVAAPATTRPASRRSPGV